MSERLRVVILGIMGRTPVAGVAWQVLQYMEGFRRLGHEVHYVEDTGDWPYDPEQDSVTEDCRYTIAYIARNLASCGLSERWAYRAGAQAGKLFGSTEAELARLFESADMLVNLTGSTELRPEHLRVPRRVYLETDPGLPQFEVAAGNRKTIEVLRSHTHLFTYAENLCAPDCRLPVGPFEYRPTRPPIVLDWWESSGSADERSFTTIASWKQSGKDIEWQGDLYTWSKHHEFLRFIELPRKARRPIELALACRDAEVIRLLDSHGWQVVDAGLVSKEIGPYRDYVQGSRGEFTVAKDQYVRTRSGWFSDRSACYLAAGRPVVTQETGFSKIVPTGRGLFGFTTMEDVLAAFDRIDADYEASSRAAREIAREYFAAETIVGDLVERAA